MRSIEQFIASRRSAFWALLWRISYIATRRSRQPPLADMPAATIRSGGGRGKPVEEGTSYVSVIVAEMHEGVVIAVAAKREKRPRAEKRVKEIVRANDDAEEYMMYGSFGRRREGAGTRANAERRREDRRSWCEWNLG
jgi:hypothetical protein